MDTYEKKYKELVGKIEKAYLYAQTDSTKAVLEEIRPELKSEDERIRRFLHHTFTAQYLCKDKLGKWHGEPVVNILAWLEKQGEKPQGKTYIFEGKSVLEAINKENVEPKFKAFDYENANIQQKDFAPKSQRIVSAEEKEALYGKPTWSEEDKDFMYDTLSNLTELKDRYGEGYGNVGKCIDWLKSLKQRIYGAD